MAAPSRRLDVLVVSYRRPDLLARCLDSVAKHVPEEQVRVWDNRSADSGAIRELARGYPHVDWTFSPENIGFAAAVNRLVERGENDTLLLNPDAELCGPLRAARAALAEPRVAATSPLVVDPAGRARPWDVAHRRQGVLRVLMNHAGYAGRLRGTPVSDLYPSPPDEVDGYLTGCSLLVARTAWRDVGPFDERFFLYAEELDWQRRARARGWRLRLADEPDVRHASAGTSNDQQPLAHRANDLRMANTAIAVGVSGSRGPGTLVTLGNLVLDRVQRSKRRRRRRAREAAETALPAAILTTRELADDAAGRRRVQLADELAERGHPVTVVCLGALGALAPRLHPAVRIVLRAWWQPVLDLNGSAVAVSGTSGPELAFAAAWRRLPGRAGRRWVVAAPHAPMPAWAAALVHCSDARIDGDGAVISSLATAFE